MERKIHRLQSWRRRKLRFWRSREPPWNGATNWGDAVIRLDSNATRILGNYTPTNTDELDSTDADLGSTSPFVLGSGYIGQGGKDVTDWTPSS